MSAHPLPWTKMPEKYSAQRYVVLDAAGYSVVSGVTEHAADQLVALSEGPGVVRGARQGDPKGWIDHWLARAEPEGE